MESIFISVLNMSITGSYVILAVMLIRLLLGRAPRKYSYLLWSVVGFRLCCPVTFESVFSLFSIRPFDMTAAQNPADHVLTYIPEDIGMMETPQITTGIPAANSLIHSSMPEGVIHNLSGHPTYSANPMQIWTAVGMYLWLIGMAALVVYAVISCIILHRRLRFATILRDNVWQSENVQSPFILGIVKPKIYIPYRLDDEILGYILTHEHYHIRCLDHVVKPIAFLILTVHWFNPLVWLAFVLMGRDMEMRCDEWVLSRSDGIRRAYSTGLLSFASNRRFPSPTPLAFGETGVKGRIQNVLRWKKPKTWITVTALILCIAVLAACAANPAKNGPDENFSELQNPFDRKYNITGAVYMAAAFSYTPPIDDIPDYRITLDGQLRVYGIDLQSSVFLGDLTEITLTEKNFDDLVDTSVWAGEDSGANAERWNSCGVYDSPADIRKNNARAWKADTEISNIPPWYYFLQQKDGSYLLCVSYTDYITWIHCLEPANPEGVYHSVNCVYMTPLSSSMGGADSGYLYYLTDTYFSVLQKNDGTTVFTKDLADTDGWQHFPYSVSEWSELFLPLGGSDYEIVRHGEWLDFGRYALWRKDEQMRIYNIHDQVGIWSAYDLEAGEGDSALSGDEVIGAFLTEYSGSATVTAWIPAPDTVWYDGFVLFTDEESGTKCNLAAVDITDVDGEDIVTLNIRQLDCFSLMEPADYTLRYLGNGTVSLDIIEEDGRYEYTVSFQRDNTSAYEKVKITPYPETMPDDFDVRMEMWVDVSQKNIFDTYDGFVQKDLVRAGTFGKQFEPSREMMEEIYARLVECDLASVNKEITRMGLYGQEGYISPNVRFQLYFTVNGREYLILGDSTGLHTDHGMAQRTNDFLYYLAMLKEELQVQLKFPEEDGGYM